MVAVVAGPAGKLAGRDGFRRVLLAGFVVFAAGLVWYATRVGLQPDYLAMLAAGHPGGRARDRAHLPGASAAAVSSLHPERFAVGSAVNQTARQVGGALGVALLVAILGRPRCGRALAHFRHLWVFAAAMAVLSGAICTLLRPTAVAPATAASPADLPPATAPPVVAPAGANCLVVEQS